MKLALAQIHARLGDLDGICARVEQQLAIAHEAGADLLCLPSPLFCGVTPGTLVESADFEHDLLCVLQRLARVADDLGMACLAPAVLALESGQLFEIFMLRKGRVVPLRLTMVRHQEILPVSPWSPPIFEVAGTRIAATFDAARDLDSIPNGCDMVIFFPVNGFDMTDPSTTAVASVSQGGFRSEVERAGVWFACMEPLGGYDDAVYTGGSFVMDDGGRVVAQAPCFEEALLVQEVRRGVMVDAVALHDLPMYRREIWLWEALRLHVRDAVAAHGFGRVIVPLTGDLPNSLLAVLAVDALGPRNVLGLLVGHEDALTSAQEVAEAERSALAREVATGLHMRLLERTAPSATLLVDRDVPAPDDSGMRRGIDALLLADTARELSALVLAPFTKTDYALRANTLATLQPCCLAPFGDVYLSALEWVAKFHARVSSALPNRLMGSEAVSHVQATIVRDAIGQLNIDEALDQRARHLLESIDSAQIDATLEAHVDRNAAIDALPLSTISPEASALLLMLVRHNESGRRMLPPAPIVSARGFTERLWPVQLAWSDMGTRGEERLRALDFAEAEYRRMERKGSERSEQARGEIFGMLGEMLGLTPEQQAELMSEESQERMREELREMEGNLRELFRRMAESGEGSEGPGASPTSGFSFFSLN